MKKEKVSIQVAQKLESMIMEGALKPGDKLPAERLLAQQMRISRASLRQAIQALVSKNMLETKQGSGTFVSEQFNQDLSAPLLGLIKQDRRSRFDVLELRRILEPIAAAQAATRCSSTDQAIIEKYYHAMQAAHAEKDVQMAAQADTRFHLSIVETSGNLVLLHVIRSLYSVMEQSIELSLEHIYPRQGFHQRLDQQHQAIMQGVFQGHPEQASLAIKEHIDFVENVMREVDEQNTLAERAKRRLNPFDS